MQILAGWARLRVCGRETAQGPTESRKQKERLEPLYLTSCASAAGPLIGPRRGGSGSSLRREDGSSTAVSASRAGTALKMTLRRKRGGARPPGLAVTIR